MSKKLQRLLPTIERALELIVANDVVAVQGLSGKDAEYLQDRYGKKYDARKLKEINSRNRRASYAVHISR